MELVRPVPGLDGVTARCFSGRERAALSHVAAGTRLGAFFAAWTLKEAYVKACGDGLTRDLDRVEVAIGAERLTLVGVRDRPGDEGRWSVHALAPGDGYVGALVAEGRDHRIHRWRWQGEPPP